jgi:hypothetical protein
VEEAVVVDVAEVAGRRPRLVLGVLRGAGLLRVAVVLERPDVALEVDGADLAGGELAALVVADVDRSPAPRGPPIRGAPATAED